MQYIFQFGTHPDISLAELIAAYPPAKQGHFIADRFFLAEIQENAEKIMARLGGIIKIMRIADVEPSADALADLILSLTKTYTSNQKRKLNFGISIIESQIKPIKLGIEIKKLLKNKSAGRPIRFVASREPVLSSVIVEKEHLLPPRGAEITVLNGKVGYTMVVQPWEEFSKRDFGRPGRNARRGMMSPKLARILLNIAIGEKNPEKMTIYDPFCGSGTILAEAILVGVQNLLGSDISKQAVSDTQATLDWFLQKYESKPLQTHIFQHDIRKKPMLAPKSIDAIVTEGYLGRPLRAGQTHSQTEKTEILDLYRVALLNLRQILKKDSVIVLVLPFNAENNISLPIEKIVDKTDFELIKPIKTAFSLKYSRRNQRVGREIIILKPIN